MVEGAAFLAGGSGFAAGAVFAFRFLGVAEALGVSFPALLPLLCLFSGGDFRGRFVCAGCRIFSGLKRGIPCIF